MLIPEVACNPHTGLRLRSGVHPCAVSCTRIAAPGDAVKVVLSLVMTPTPNIVPLAITAEQAGWAMVTLSDHVVNVEAPKTPYPYTPDGKRRWPEFTEFPDQLVMIAAAAVTTRLRFTTERLCAPDARSVFRG
jgi:alkanesulfonate monooxygenase SsuD/methylene tetrahydromethanopterin reductase-like flavin-dependent oxidoreductase (luciferase family)